MPHVAQCLSVSRVPRTVTSTGERCCTARRTSGSRFGGMVPGSEKAASAMKVVETR